VSVYLDDGQCASAVASTIVDLTGPEPRLLRRRDLDGTAREVAAITAG